MPKPRFQFHFAGKIDLTEEEVLPDETPENIAKLELLSEFKGVTIPELLWHWGFEYDIRVTIIDLETGARITRKGKEPWKVKV